MLKIRLQRIGRRNNPSYRVAVVDSRYAAKKGNPVEMLGSYDTIRKTTELNKERILYWISEGAQLSDTMHNILVKNDVIKSTKKNVLPKKSPIEKEKAEEEVVEKKEEVSAETPETKEEAKTETVEEEKTEEVKEEVKEEATPETAEETKTEETKDEPEQSAENDPSKEG